MSTVDLIRHVKLSTARCRSAVPISDAKVFTGRQKPMTEVVFLFAEITTELGHTGLGFSYSKRAGGPAQYAHAKEVAEGIIGEDPNDIGRDLHQAPLGRRLRGPLRGGHPGPRGHRHRPV